MDKPTTGDELVLAARLLRRSVVREGKPFPLGATWDGLGVNFALFSAHATKVELCLFDANGKTERERIELPEYMRSGTATCRPRVPVWSTAIACTVRTSRTPAIDLIRTSL